MPDFTDAQLRRIDEVYNRIVELCKFFTQGEFDAEDLKTYGPLADEISDVLVKAGYKVYFPTCITDSENGDRIVDYLTSEE